MIIPSKITQLVMNSPRNSLHEVIIGSVIVELLLLLSGDVEMNPGPVSHEELTSGLTTLITEAPSGVKPVLGVWAPDKENMEFEWNSSKFTVPVLREAVAWLRNKSAEEVVKNSLLKKKADLATELPIAIERLLPNKCGNCRDTYSVNRADTPTLQCLGCQSGIHEVCLRETLGEGAATLSTLHGSLTWLCPNGGVPMFRGTYVPRVLCSEFF